MYRTVNRSTFNCPCCSEKNLSREGLLEHVKLKHRNASAICPICLAQPWGDPNYITQLHGHLQKRHKFDYDTTVDYQDSEEAILQKILQESINDR